MLLPLVLDVTNAGEDEKRMVVAARLAAARPAAAPRRIIVYRLCRRSRTRQHPRHFRVERLWCSHHFRTVSPRHLVVVFSFCHCASFFILIFTDERSDD